jgi:hypothetical protein
MNQSATAMKGHYRLQFGRNNNAIEINDSSFFTFNATILFMLWLSNNHRHLSKTDTKQHISPSRWGVLTYPAS